MMRLKTISFENVLRHTSMNSRFLCLDSVASTFKVMSKVNIGTKSVSY